MPVSRRERNFLGSTPDSRRSVRLQTVQREHSPRFYALIAAFAERTGVPILLNTSFNEHEPIVCSPLDALRCFVKTHMDALALHNLWLSWVTD